MYESVYFSLYTILSFTKNNGDFFPVERMSLRQMATLFT